MGAFVNKLSGIKISHQQMEMKQHGVRLCVWYQRSYPETEVYRAEAEVCKRVLSATCKRLPDTDCMVGWATISPPTSLRRRMRWQN